MTALDAVVQFQFVTSPVFARGRGLRTFDPASWAIRKWTGGPFRFSHVDAVTPQGFLMGARHDPCWSYPCGDVRAGYQHKLTGLQLRPPNYTEFSDREVVAVPCTADQAAAFWARLRADIGKPYADHDIWNFILGRASRPREGSICSVEQRDVAVESGVLPSDTGAGDWVIAPNTFYLLCRQTRAERLFWMRGV